VNYFFDLFGTLITDNPEEYRKIMSESFGLNRDGYETKVRNFISSKSFISQEIALDHLLNHLGKNFSPEETQSFFKQLETLKGGSQLHDGALEVLQALRNRGAKIGIVSNNNTFLEDLVRKFRIDDHVNAVILSHKVMLMKPDVRIYQTALKLLESKPEDVTMVGDQLDKDVLPALEMGMKAILFDPFGRNQSYEGKRIRSLRELINVYSDNQKLH